jgi:hypothetical protein
MTNGGLPGIYVDADLFSYAESPEDAERALYFALEFLTAANIAWLHAHPETPWMYDAPIGYIRDPVGVEYWQGIPKILAHFGADCKSLAAWRVAELRCRASEDGGTPPLGLARFHLEPHQTEPGTIIYHVTVVRGDDTQEDPSAILGMGAVH